MTADPAGQVVVTVVSSTRRVDLALPSAVPVADLLPDLAERVDLLDGDPGVDGHRLLTSTGRLLVPGLGLAAQEVRDGAVLTVLPGVGPVPPPVHDDPAEAVADVVAGHDPLAGPATRRRTASAMGCLLVGLGAADLVTTSTLGSVTIAAAAGAVVAALVALAVGAGRVPALAAAAAGAVLLVAEAVAGWGGWQEARVLACALVLVTVSGAVLPSLAVGASRLQPDPVEVELDLDVVAAGVRRGHELLLVGLLAEGLLVVTLAPFTASLGPWGAGLATGCCLAVLLRARLHRVGSEGLVRAGSGAAGLLAVAVTALWLQPGWRLPGAAVLLAVGGVVLALGLRSARESVRRGRLADLTETAVLLSLLPLLVPVSGVLPLVRDLVP